MNWPDFPAWLKISTTSALAAAIAAAALLFSPARFLGALGLAEFVDGYRMWVGFALVLATATVLARGVASTVMWGQELVRLRSIEKRREARLFELSPAEVKVLAGYVDGDTRTQYFDLGDGVIRGLEAEGIVFMASSISDSYTSFAYNIEPWALRYLKKHRGLLAKVRS